MPSTSYTGSECVVGRDVSKHPPWSIATSTTTAPSFIAAIISRVTSFGASAPGISTAPMTRSDSVTDAPTCNVDDMSTEAQRDHRRVVADDPAADDRHAAGRDAGYASEQQAAPAERLLEEIRA